MVIEDELVPADEAIASYRFLSDKGALAMLAAKTDQRMELDKDIWDLKRVLRDRMGRARELQPEGFSLKAIYKHRSRQYRLTQTQADQLRAGADLDEMLSKTAREGYEDVVVETAQVAEEKERG